MVDLWQYTDPSTVNVLPPSTSSINREVIKRAYEEGRRLRDHIAPECWRVMEGQTTLRGIWTSLKAGCDRGDTLPLLDSVLAFYHSKWEEKDTISSYISRLRDHYLKLENTPKAIEGETAIHILIDRLPDSYKAQGLLTKGLNLSFIETTAHLLANIKDSSSTGDNLSRNALLTRGRRNQQRDNSSRDSSANSNQSNGRGRGRRGRRGRGGHRGHRGQGNHNNHFTCHWCHQRGHIDYNCSTKFLQLANGTAKQDSKGKAYVITGQQG